MKTETNMSKKVNVSSHLWHVVDFNTAHVLRLSKADALTLSKADVLRLNNDRRLLVTHSYYASALKKQTLYMCNMQRVRVVP